MTTRLMMLTLVITLTMIVAIHREAILRTNYGSSMETLEPQVLFSTEDGRIVLYYTLPKVITAKKSPEQQREETEVFNNPCSLENPKTLLNFVYRPICRYILNLVERIFVLRRSSCCLATVNALAYVNPYKLVVAKIPTLTLCNNDDDNDREILRAYCIFMVKYIHRLFVADVSVKFRLNPWWKCNIDVVPQRPFTPMHRTSTK